MSALWTMEITYLHGMIDAFENIRAFELRANTWVRPYERDIIFVCTRTYGFDPTNNNLLYIEKSIWHPSLKTKLKLSL